MFLLTTPRYFVTVSDTVAVRGGFQINMIYPLSRWPGMIETIMRRDTMLEVDLKRFDDPDEVRVFEKGKFEIVRIGGMILGRATYQPGWRWSEHVGPLSGTPFLRG